MSLGLFKLLAALLSKELLNSIRCFGRFEAAFLRRSRACSQLWPSDRARFTKRRKEAYEALHPDGNEDPETGNALPEECSIGVEHQWSVIGVMHR